MLLNWSSFGSRLSARTDWSIWGQEAGKPQLLSAVPSISGWPRGSKAPDSVQSLLNRVEKHLQPGSNLPHSQVCSVLPLNPALTGCTCLIQENALSCVSIKEEALGQEARGAWPWQEVRCCQAVSVWSWYESTQSWSLPRWSKRKWIGV